MGNVTLSPTAIAVHVTFRATPDQVAAIDQLAHDRGVRRSDLIRSGLDLLTDRTELAAAAAVAILDAKGKQTESGHHDTLRGAKNAAVEALHDPRYEPGTSFR